MALKKKTAAKPAPAKPEPKEAAPVYKYGVPELAEELGIEPATVRVRLRNKSIEKAGRSYGWNTQAEFKGIIAALKAKDDDEEEEEAPKKKAAAPAKKPARKRASAEASA